MHVHVHVHVYCACMLLNVCMYNMHPPYKDRYTFPFTFVEFCEVFTLPLSLPLPCACVLCMDVAECVHACWFPPYKDRYAFPSTFVEFCEVSTLPLSVLTPPPSSSSSSSSYSPSSFSSLFSRSYLTTRFCPNWREIFRSGTGRRMAGRNISLC